MNQNHHVRKRTVILTVALAAALLAATGFIFLRTSARKGSSARSGLDTSVSILFIGNSHTYYNDLPGIVQHLAAEDGYDCRITMLAHGGWYLRQHVEQPEVRFNILYGGYDYVVLQEYAQPFVQEAEYRESARQLNQWVREAGSIPVIYETWSVQSAPENQNYMNEVHHRIADEIDALLAPVGEKWWDYQESHPQLDMFDPDGEHASAEGSAFAAECIWETIRQSLS
ncbi:MAG: SGNH/GDSL hydrolase family protein [Eubacterium sp.]|nr:SGNH/GDSL hydrolase family protein [Eubacterium sp.]